MRHKPIHLVAAAVVLLTGCKQESTPAVQETSPASTTSASVSVAATTAAHIVQVDFYGLISHVMENNGAAPPRAVVLAGGAARTATEHIFTIVVPPVKDRNKLTFIGTPSCPQVTDPCEVSGITAISLSIPALTGSITQSVTFTKFVPGLQDASGNTMPKADLQPELNAASPPAAGSPFLAFFDYTGGTLSAVPFCGLAEYDTGGAARRFAQVVTLTGTTASEPKLVATKPDGTTETIEFVDPDYVSIEVHNRAKNSKMDHFHLFSGLSTKSVTLPKIKKDKACSSAKGTVIGCSDTRYP